MSDNAVIIGQGSVGRGAAWTAARHGGRPDRSERLPARSAQGAARHKQLWSRGLGLKGRILLHLIYIETSRWGCYDGSEMGADEDDEQRSIQRPVLGRV